jgi:hypothetical protein
VSYRFVWDRQRVFIGPPGAEATINELLDEHEEARPPWVELTKEKQMPKTINLYVRMRDGSYAETPLSVDVDDSEMFSLRVAWERENLSTPWPTDALADGEEVEVSDDLVQTALEAFFGYGKRVSDWQHDARGAMREALRAVAGKAIGNEIDVSELGAFLAGEGTITIEEANLWASAFGYERMTGDEGADPRSELMISLVKR